MKKADISKTKGMYNVVYSELVWKHELNLRSSHWNSSVKTVFLEIFQISQENTCVEVSFSAALLKKTPTQMFSCGIYKFSYKNT